VTKIELFRNFIEKECSLELSSFNATKKPLAKESDGTYKTAGLRHVAYKSFLNMCSLRGLGQGRRYVLPACVVTRIKEIFPSPDGQYIDFKEGNFNSRV